MNQTINRIRTTIVFGFICAISFTPARILADQIPLFPYPSDYRLIFWVYLAGYALLLSRWSETPTHKLFFPLLLPLLFIGWQGSDMTFFICLLFSLSQIRGGICFSSPLFKTVAAEALICFGSAALASYWSPRSLLAWSLGVWLFFLGQSIYFIFITPDNAPRVEPESDVFESARRRAETILGDQAL